MGLCHPLEQHRTAAAADQAAHPVAQDAMLLERDDPLAVLPSQSKIVTATVTALFDWNLIHHSHSPVCVLFKHTIPEEQTNSQRKKCLLRKFYESNNADNQDLLRKIVLLITAAQNMTGHGLGFCEMFVLYSASNQGILETGILTRGCRYECR